LGFALGWSYWFKYIILVPNQLTATSLVIKYWLPQLNPGVFITLFLLTIIFINYFGIKFFGEFEFWLSTIKVLTLCGVIILSLILALGGGPDHDRKVLFSYFSCGGLLTSVQGFRYWKHPGAFNKYPGSKSIMFTVSSHF
jgi:amino acid transporter